MPIVAKHSPRTKRGLLWCGLALTASLLMSGPASGKPAVTECDRLTASESDPQRVALPVQGTPNPDAAIPACEQALRNDPDNPRLLHQLGLVLGERNASQGLALMAQAAEKRYAESAYLLYTIHFNRWRESNDTRDLFTALEHLVDAVAYKHPRAAVSAVPLRVKYNDIIEGMLQKRHGLGHQYFQSALLEASRQTIDPRGAAFARERIAVSYPNGLMARKVKPGDDREYVGDTNKSPFSAIGRLYIVHRPSGKASLCTASVVGDRSTVTSSAHCFSVDGHLTGLEVYYDPQGGDLPKNLLAQVADYANSGRLIRAKVRKLGMHPEADVAQSEDWAVLDLERPLPSSIRPLLILDANGFAKFEKGEFARAPFEAIGFPMDVETGRKMVYTIGCGIAPSAVAKEDTAYVARTTCTAYHGMSGGPVLLRRDGHYTVVGLISHGPGGAAVKGRADVYGEVYITVSRAMNKVIEDKIGRTP